MNSLLGGYKRTLVVVIHVGINDIHDRQTEVLKNTFTQLTCKLKEKHFMAINKYGVHRKLLVLLIIGTYFGGGHTVTGETDYI